MQGAWGRGEEEMTSKRWAQAEDQGTARHTAEQRGAWEGETGSSSVQSGRGGWKVAPEAVPKASRRRQTGSVRGATMAPVDGDEARNEAMDEDGEGTACAARGGG